MIVDVAPGLWKKFPSALDPGTASCTSTCGVPVVIRSVGFSVRSCVRFPTPTYTSPTTVSVACTSTHPFSITKPPWIVVAVVMTQHVLNGLAWLCHDVVVLLPARIHTPVDTVPDSGCVEGWV